MVNGWFMDGSSPNMVWAMLAHLRVDGRNLVGEALGTMKRCTDISIGYFGRHHLPTVVLLILSIS